MVTQRPTDSEAGLCSGNRSEMGRAGDLLNGNIGIESLQVGDHD
jgi:hypothetical protein